MAHEDKVNGMRRAAQIFMGCAMAMDENPQEMVSRGQMASTLRDIASELERQADQIETDSHLGQMESRTAAD